VKVREHEKKTIKSIDKESALMLFFISVFHEIFNDKQKTSLSTLVSLNLATFLDLQFKI
jgi:hypothetical protein